MDLLRQARDLLADFPCPWAFCGGYALEVFAGREIRPHGDIDLCIFEPHRAQIIAHLLRKGWRLYEYRGMGKVKPLHDSACSESGRSLMALLPDCPLVDFFPCEEEGLLYHQFRHAGMTELRFLDLLFSRTQGDALQVIGVTRPLDKAVLLRHGMPILAPEIALLYKASRPEEASAQLDFAAVAPLLNDEQRTWLRSALAAHFPAGHPWLT